MSDSAHKHSDPALSCQGDRTLPADQGTGISSPSGFQWNGALQRAESWRQSSLECHLQLTRGGDPRGGSSGAAESITHQLPTYKIFRREKSPKSFHSDTRVMRQGLSTHRPAITIDDPARYHFGDSFPVLGFSFHWSSQ